MKLNTTLLGTHYCNTYGIKHKDLPTDKQLYEFGAKELTRIHFPVVWAFER